MVYLSRKPRYSCSHYTTDFCEIHLHDLSQLMHFHTFSEITTMTKSCWQFCFIMISENTNNGSTSCSLQNIVTSVPR